MSEPAANSETAISSSPGRKLDIIVPHYKESWDVGEKLFQMIGLQRGISTDDFRVTIVNDGGHRVDEEHLKQFRYPIRQIDIPHKGVSAARNAGMDAADGRWVMFCDFDDTFATAYSLRDIITVLDADMDMMYSRIVVEDFTDGHDLLYISPDVQKLVFCHGKVYRLDFLREKKIRFDEGMNFQEDSLFNSVVVARTPHTRVAEIKTLSPVYIWIRRASSVTNSGREDEAIMGHFIRNLKVTEENRLNREFKCYCGMVTRTAWDTYYMIHGNEASNRLKRKILDLFIPWMRERMKYYGKAEPDILDKIREVARSELYKGGYSDSPADVGRWLNITLYGGADNGNPNN